jgi:hypothetical protein
VRLLVCELLRMLDGKPSDFPKKQKFGETAVVGYFDYH